MKNKENACPAKKCSIGGQALIEGIMMRGPKKSAIAVRDPKGNMVVEEWDNKSKKRLAIFKWAIIRGVFGFIDSMTIGYKALMRSAEIAIDEEEEERLKEEKKAKKNKKPKKEKNPEEEKKESSAFLGIVMGVASVLGTVLAVALFMLLPTYIYAWLENVLPFLPINNPELAPKDITALNSLVKSSFEGVLRIIILVAYMALITLMKDIRRTFMYHGAEHKTIFCYENGLELTVENVRKQRRFHPRCGTSFLILMLIVSIFISFFIDPIFILINGAPAHVAVRSVIKLLLLPLNMGIGYELIKLAGKHDNLFTRIISAPGMWLQHLTVLEPDDDMIECAIEAFVRVLPENEKKPCAEVTEETAPEAKEETNE